MKIAYVKTRKDKDSILQMLRQILPEDRIMCADISTVVGSAFDRVKINHIISKGHPGLLIAYGEAAGVLVDIYPQIPTVMIDPVGDINDASLDFVRDTTQLFVVQTGMTIESLNADDLLKSISPIMESMREDIQNNEDILEKLIDMAMVKTDAAPENFDGNDNITDNLTPEGFCGMYVTWRLDEGLFSEEVGTVRYQAGNAEEKELSANELAREIGTIMMPFLSTHPDVGFESFRKTMRIMAKAEIVYCYHSPLVGEHPHIRISEAVDAACEAYGSRKKVTDR